MTRFIEIADTNGNKRLINLSAIASVEDRRKSIVIRCINPEQPPIALSLSYETFKSAIDEGDPIIPGGVII